LEFRTLLSRHAAVAVEKQLRLARSVAGSSWSWDLAAGTLVIAGTHWSFQLLGIERAADARWRWAWADADNGDGDGLPDALIRAARTLRAFGARQGVRELVEPEVDLRRAAGQSFAALACGLLDARGFWRAPFDGGVAWLLLTDRAAPGAARPLPAEMARVLTRTLAILPVDHAIALDAYVLHHGGSVERAGATATARLRGGGRMVAHFDEGRRIERLEAKVA